MCPSPTAYSLFSLIRTTHIHTHTQANYYIDVFSVRYQSKYPHERPLGLGKVPVLNSPKSGKTGHVAAAVVVGGGGGGGEGGGGRGAKSKES